MSRQTLQDKNHRTIGYIETDSAGKQKIMDRDYKTLGYYDPKANKTTDRDYRTVGHGNLLTALLKA